MIGVETLDDRVPFVRPPARRAVSSHAFAGPLVLAVAVLIGTGIAYVRLNSEPVAVVPAPKAAARLAQQPASLPAPAPADMLRFDSALLDASNALGVVPAPFGENLPLGPAFVIAMPPTVVADVAPLLPAVQVPPVVEVAEAIPLPAPRPSILQIMTPRPLRAPSAKIASIKPPVEEDSLFDRLFRPRPASPVLAYAAPEAGLFGGVGRATFNPTAAYDGVTAVYDISAHTVYLPNGTRLEAHSGLGNRLDDPRYVAEQNRGPTPPHVYDLQPREQLFHGRRGLAVKPCRRRRHFRPHRSSRPHLYARPERRFQRMCLVRGLSGVSHRLPERPDQAFSSGRAAELKLRAPPYDAPRQSSGAASETLASLSFERAPYMKAHC